MAVRDSSSMAPEAGHPVLEGEPWRSRDLAEASGEPEFFLYILYREAVRLHPLGCIEYVGIDDVAELPVCIANNFADDGKVLIRRQIGVRFRNIHILVKAAVAQEELGAVWA